MLTRKIGKAFLAAALLQLVLAPPLFAQAWLPSKGEGTYSIVYQNIYARDHMYSSGEKFERGPIQSHGLPQDFGFGLTDRIALNLSLPYVASKYEGPYPHARNTDDGRYHGAFQDFHVGLRYNLSMRPLVITPFVEGILPSHDYEVFAHSAIGQRLRELVAGVNLGRQLDPVLRRAYFETRISYGVREKLHGLRPNRSRVDGEFGYFVTRRLVLRAFESFQITHQGLDYPEDYESISRELELVHDPLQKISFLNLGGGVAFVLMDSWDVFASALTLVWGENGHAPRAFVVGTNWRFSTGRRTPVS